MAFLHRLKVRGTRVWAVSWDDLTKGVGHAGRRRVLCGVAEKHDEAFTAAEFSPAERMALAHGANNAAQRQKLLKAYEALELVKARDSQRSKALGAAPALDTPVNDFLDAFRRLVNYRVALGANDHAVPPDEIGWRNKLLNTPLRRTTSLEILRTLGRFRDALPQGMTTGGLTADHVGRFLTRIRSERGLSSASINNMRRYLSAMFGAPTNRATKQLFRTDPLTWFRDEVEALPKSRHEIVTYAAKDIVAFLEAAERQSEPNRKVVVVRRKKGGKLESFEQSVSTEPAPVLQWALLLACTGVRCGEAELLRWSNVDLEHGVITVNATKTGATRYVPLVGDPTGNVSPGFAAVLRAWRRQRPTDLFVLPSANGTPSFPKHGWLAAAAAAGVNVGPQGLRRTFESSLAAIGFPASLAAFWLGHTVQIAESNYRAYRPGRLPGATVDAALGLTPFLEREAKAATATTLSIMPRIQSLA